MCCAGSPQPTAGYGMVAAINTPGLNNTDQCGTCYAVSCVNGPTRGLPGSQLPDSGCISSKPITVMITDSCPCDHANPDNQKWCCGDTTHLDLSHMAFGMIADHSKGVVDLKIQKLDSCPGAQHGVNTQTCDVLQKYHAAFKAADFCRALFGAAVSCLFAGYVLMYLITGVWQRLHHQRYGPYGAWSACDSAEISMDFELHIPLCSCKVYTRIMPVPRVNKQE